MHTCFILKILNCPKLLPICAALNLSITKDPSLQHNCPKGFSTRFIPKTNFLFAGESCSPLHFPPYSDWCHAAGVLWEGGGPWSLNTNLGPGAPSWGISVHCTFSAALIKGLWTIISFSLSLSHIGPGMVFEVFQLLLCCCVWYMWHYEYFGDEKCQILLLLLCQKGEVIPNILEFPFDVPSKAYTWALCSAINQIWPLTVIIFVILYVHWQSCESDFHFQLAQ